MRLTDLCRQPVLRKRGLRQAGFPRQHRRDPGIVLRELLYAAANGKLAGFGPLWWREGAAVCVVVANEGYPGETVTGRPVYGADQEGVLHAGTALDTAGQLIATGGRVLNCIGTGASVAQARQEAYMLAEGVKIEGCHFRGDIAAGL